MATTSSHQPSEILYGFEESGNTRSITHTQEVLNKKMKEILVKHSFKKLLKHFAPKSGQVQNLSGFQLIYTN